MFELKEKNGIKFVQLSEFNSTGIVKHGFSTRIGGVSTGEAATMNFGSNRKDTPENIRENFRLLFDVLGCSLGNQVPAKQVHGDTVYAVSKSDAGRELRECADALITNEKNLPLCTFHADCIPVLIVDPVQKAVGAVHSGWRSTVLNIAAKTVEALKSNYNCKPENLLCSIGPSIGPCHFEVGSEVAEMFDIKYITLKEKPHINLWDVVKDQLIHSGVRKENIFSSGMCTYCGNDLFYSYRGDNRKTGSMVSVIELGEVK